MSAVEKLPRDFGGVSDTSCDSAEEVAKWVMGGYVVVSIQESRRRAGKEKVLLARIE